MQRQERVVIPVAREEIAVDKRARPVERVRVRKRVVEENVPVELVSAREHVDVHRVAVGRIVATLPEPRVEGNTTIIPVVEETLVVEKRLLLKEEIHITKRRSEQKRVVNVALKREQVNIERNLAESEHERR